MGNHKSKRRVWQVSKDLTDRKTTRGSPGQNGENDPSTDRRGNWRDSKHAWLTASLDGTNAVTGTRGTWQILTDPPDC